MAGHEFQGRQISSKELCGALRAILMIDAVKSIATNPLREPFERTGLSSGGLRPSAVKAGIEDSDLENRAKAFLDDVDPFQLGAIVERRKSGHACYGRFHFRRDGGCFFKVFATVYDTMTYYLSLRWRWSEVHLSISTIDQQVFH